MFKATSENMQLREVRAAQESRKNSAGLDPSIFKSSMSERDLLVERLKGLQDNASKLAQSISEAKGRYSGHISGRIVSYETVMRWERDKAANAVEIHKVQAKLTDIRRSNKAEYDRKGVSFERAFMTVAKEMLVEEAYNRIVIATTHRISGLHESD